MQLVVVMAVRNAVSAATTTFTAISKIFFFIIAISFFCHTEITEITERNPSDLRITQNLIISKIFAAKQHFCVFWAFCVTL